MSDIQIRDLTTIDEFRQVVELEKAIWGYTDHGDLVTRPGVHLHRASRRDADRRVRHSLTGRHWSGFAYAVVGMKAGKPMLWSHMAGVLPEYPRRPRLSASSWSSAIARWRRATT